MVVDVLEEEYDLTWKLRHHPTFLVKIKNNNKKIIIIYVLCSTNWTKFLNTIMFNYYFKVNLKKNYYSKVGLCYILLYVSIYAPIFLPSNWPTLACCCFTYNSVLTLIVCNGVVVFLFFPLLYFSGGIAVVFLSKN